MTASARSSARGEPPTARTGIAARPCIARSAAMSASEVASIRSVMPGLLPRARVRKSSIDCWRYSLVLAGDARLGAFALVLALVAAGTPDRAVGADRPGRDIRRRRRLLQVGPSLLRKIERQRHHVLARQRFGQGRHDVVLARAALVVAQLEIEIALVLAPDHRRGLLLRNAVLAVAGRAQLRFLLDRLRSVMEPAAGACRAIAHMKKTGPSGPVCVTPMAVRVLLRRIQSNVKAMMLLPRLKSSWTLPPAATTMYCLPPTV